MHPDDFSKAVRAVAHTYSRTQAVAAIRAMNMAVTVEDGEFRVTFKAIDMHDPERREAVAYYTNDPTDAVDTARAMLAQFNAR